MAPAVPLDLAARAVEQLRELGHRWATGPDVDADAARGELLAACTAAVPGARASTVTTWSAQEMRPRHQMADGPAGTLADFAQVRAGCGPATLAAETGQTVSSADMWEDSRWPALRRDETIAADIGSVLCVPLAGSAATCRVLTTYGDQGSTPGASEEALLVQVVRDVTHALDVLDLRARARDLETALVSNRAISAAIGVVMRQHLLTYDAAATLLKRASNQSNTKLRDLADDVLHTGHLATHTAPRSHPVRL